jgi:hypothetical protein
MPFHMGATTCLGLYECFVPPNSENLKTPFGNVKTKMLHLSVFTQRSLAEIGSYMFFMLVQTCLVILKISYMLHSVEAVVKSTKGRLVQH